MPELPEVETTRRGLAPHIQGRKVLSLVVRPLSLRWPIPADLPSRLAGKTLLDLDRRGKYLLLGFESGTALIHLGMSGSLRIAQPDEPAGVHDHFDLVFKGCVLRYRDPRRFGCLLWTDQAVQEHPLLSHLGPEPLSDNFDANYLFQRSRKRRLPVKQFLMDSKIVVGVGNIYANEALFLTGVKPIRKAGTLTRKECENLVGNIKQVLQRAIVQGGTTLRDFIGGDGQPGYFAQELLVYGRGGLACPTCERALKEVRMNNRSTVYCVSCQACGA